jgi:acetyl-CoA carboxylase carboxyl transferase subunit alpha
MINRHWLDFEKPVIDIEKKIEELKSYPSDEPDAHKAELLKLEKKAGTVLKDLYSKLTPWQVTKVARHPARPYMLDYVRHIFDDFIELHGDRCYKDDKALVGGLATLNGEAVVVIGQQKGRKAKEMGYRNWGMPNPEGYRKAVRLMELAERFKRPILTFIDTPGAYPGVGAEERGQSEAIAESLMKMSTLKVPLIATIIGEGGSGGALAIGVADKVLMMQFSTYSVISPEGCAAILWKDGTKADIAAKALKINAEALKSMGIIDKIIKEPIGGAHRSPQTAYKNLKAELVATLKKLKTLSTQELLDARYKKFRDIGAYVEGN